VDTLDCVDLDGDVDMERDSDDEVEKDEQEEVEEEEDEDDDDGKEPRTNCRGEMVNKTADDVDTMVDDQPIVLPEQGQEMCKHILWTQHPAHAPQPQTPEPRPRPRTLETLPICKLEHLGLVIPQNPRPAVPTLREAQATGNTSNVNRDQQLLIKSAGGHSLSAVPLPDVPVPDVPLSDVCRSEARPDCLEVAE
jgi:hypothetical protein